MKLVALISGGKDSCYNMLQCIAAGHEIVALAHLKPKDQLEELDSHMYQSVGHDGVKFFARALNLPLYQADIEGGHLCRQTDYVQSEGDEVEDLHSLLEKVKAQEGVQGVASGAILSNYQRVRVENVCARLGLVAYAYLWRRNQAELLSEMIASGTRAILIKVATLGLNPEQHLGKEISEIFPHLLKMHERYGLNVCGEGGEYETFTLDCPLFRERIVVDEQITINHSRDAFAPVAYIKFQKLHLERKPGLDLLSQRDVIREPGIRGPECFLIDLDVDYQSQAARSDGDEASETCQPEKRGVNSPGNFARCNSGWFWLSECAANSGGDPAEVMAAVLESLRNALGANELSTSDLVSVQLFVKDMREFAALNASYKLFFDLNPPSRVCVQAPLPDDVQFLMHCVGFKLDQQDCNGKQSLVDHMHVQSVSHWAPANIGPYSQAVQVGDFIYVAGQIGLIPSTMEMIGGGLVAESRLSLRHASRVLEAMGPRCELENVLFCVCYVTHRRFVAAARMEWAKASKSDASENHFALSCVVVPALPRGAVVEWQVIAHREHPQSWSWKRLDVISIDSISAECVIGRFNDEGVLIARCYSTVADTTVTQQDTINEIFSHLTELVVDSIDDATFHFQVYYSVARTKWDHLQNAWKRLNFANAGLSLIPISSGETDVYVMDIFTRFG